MIDPFTKLRMKPCPFCGKDVAAICSGQELEDCRLFEDKAKCPAFEFDCGCNMKRVVCNVHMGGCGASSPYTWEGDAKAIELWNRRSDESQN